MATKTFRIFISGKISPRHSNVIIHNMLTDLGYVIGNDQTTPTIRNMHRGVDESYFDIDFLNIDNNIDYIAKVNEIKRYVIESSSVQYQDITNEPPKDM
jgi:hypothetical protein